MRISLIILLFTFSASVLANNANGQNVPKKKSNINKLDKQGKRHGTWLNKVAPRKGEYGYSEFGSYIHGFKNGLWYKMNTEGDLVAIENYKNDYFDGEVKYFTKGQVTCIGNYRGLNPDREYDTVLVENPVTGEQSLVPVKTERGTFRHGLWRYYNETTGALEMVQEYQIDSLIYEESINFSRQDSIRMQQQAQSMPHTKNQHYKPPSEKQFRYTK